MARTNIENFRDLFIYELRDLYSAEDQLVNAIPKLVHAASSQSLKDAFNAHLEEAKQQKQRLSKISEMLGVEVKGVTCKGMEGLIEECSDVINVKADESVKDAALIAAAQRIEHYEIAGYGTAHHFATMLHENDISDMLSESLKEEKAGDERLNRVAKETVNIKAEKVH